MEAEQRVIRTTYRFSDYLYYTATGLVPLLTGVVAIYPQSVLGLVSYGIVALACAGMVLYYFCTRCPHYTQEGRWLRCLFFWGLPKFFKPRPGPLRAVDKIVALAAPLLLFAFPLPWLAEDPGLLAIYLLSLAVFGATVRRNECGRCRFYDCPANKVPPEAVTPESKTSDA
jgi:hypothetical protein